MFRCSQNLQKRKELRLQGFRAPAIRILRNELRKVKPTTETPVVGRKHAQLRQYEQFESLTLHDILVGHRNGRRLSQRTRDVSVVPKSRGWTHSIYAYEQSKLKSIPITTSVANAAIKAYFNMLPREFSDLSLEQDVLFRAFISDKNRPQPVLKQDITGKIVGRRKNGFLKQLRELMALEPVIEYKHFCYGRTDIRLYVHEGRFDILDKGIANMGAKLLRLTPRTDS